jgi:hypothetical protein
LAIVESDYELIKNPEAQCKNCSNMESDKRKLREATPEITTSQKYDSNIKILPKYQCKASFHLNHNGYHYEHF